VTVTPLILPLLLSGRFLRQTEICRYLTESDGCSGWYSRDLRNSLKPHFDFKNIKLVELYFGQNQSDIRILGHVVGLFSEPSEWGANEVAWTLHRKNASAMDAEVMRQCKHKKSWKDIADVWVSIRTTTSNVGRYKWSRLIEKVNLSGNKRTMHQRMYFVSLVYFVFGPVTLTFTWWPRYRNLT